MPEKLEIAKDYINYSNSSCISASRPATSLNQIFTEIAGHFTVSRLIPNKTT